jgi:transcriptional regulator with XRE-family HTH domain
VPEQLEAVGRRFAEERQRLGLGVQEAADNCGVSRQQIRRAEGGENWPGGELLAAFTKLGADAQYVLIGTRSGLIDLTQLGMSEAALRNEYKRHRGVAELPGPIRIRMSALVYNQLVGKLRPGDDLGTEAGKLAEWLLESMEDPADPDQLERSLFQTGKVAATTPQVAVTGKGHRVAGRDYHEGKKG